MTRRHVEQIIWLPIWVFALMASHCPFHGDDTPSGPTPVHVGVYALATIDGQPLPFDFEGEFEFRTIQSGNLELKGNSEWEDSSTADVTDKATNAMERVTVTSSGVYTVTGDTVTLSDRAGGRQTITATLSQGRDRLTFSENLPALGGGTVRRTFVYRR